MFPRDMPDDFGRLGGSDDPRLDQVRAWRQGPEGAGVARQVADLGDALQADAFGTPPPDLSDVVSAGAGGVVEVIGRHPVLDEPSREMGYLNLFSAELDPGLEPLRIDAIDVLVRGAAGLALTGPDDDRIVGGLLATAFGIDATSAALRDILLGRPDRDPSELLDQFPELPDRVIDLDRLEQVVVWGTLRELLQALRTAGRAWQEYAAWVSRATAHAKGITGLDPDHGCAGDTVTIQGSGFGTSQPQYTSVMFPTANGRCTAVDLVIGRGRRSGWSDTAIVVKAPSDVGIGCVGFVVTDGPAPADPRGAHTELVGAAGMFQSVLGDAFGAGGVMMGQTVVNVVAGLGTIPALPCPPCLPAGSDGRIPNRFVGGPPVIRSFTVNGSASTRINPGGTVTLAWSVEAADRVAISPATASGSKWPAELPAVPGAANRPAQGSAGPFAIPYDGVDDWDGEYVLNATNECNRDQPTSWSVRIEMREKPPPLGIVDTHAHFVSHLGFAGYGPYGKPHAADATLDDVAAMREAMGHCDGPRGHGAGGIGPSLEGVGHLVGGYDEFDGWPRHTTIAHQQAYVDWIRRAVDGGLRLVVSLAVNNELVAERMTDLKGQNLSKDDNTAIIRQLDAMREMVRFLDEKAGGSGQGWLQIATTPTDARQIIAAGKLAMVLGVEVDSLGGWRTPGALEAEAQANNTTPRALIAAMVQDLYDRGVRHIFPVHASNNAFGGPALFIRNYDAVNYFLTGQSFEVESADPSLGIAYRADQDEFEGGSLAEVLGYHGAAAAKTVFGATLAGLVLGGLVGASGGATLGAAIGFGIAASQYPCPPQPTNWSGVRGGHINRQGLTQYGAILIEELMRRGMLIDIDHMGHKTTEAVLARCETQGYPVVSGHTGYRELKFGYRECLCVTAEYSKEVNANQFGTLNAKRLSSEVDKSPAQLERIRKLGGLVSTITAQRDIRDCGCGTAVANDNAGSSKSFAHAYLYAHRQMHGRRLGLGTDINGAATLPGPRFGPQGAAGIRDENDWEVRRRLGQPMRIDQVFAQRDGVRYSTPLKDYRHHRFMDYAGSPSRAPFDAEQRDFWEAIAIWRTGTNPSDAEQPTVFQRTVATQNLIINLATGLQANARSQIPLAISAGWPYNANAEEQLAAYLASHPNAPFQSSDTQRTRTLTAKLGKVWSHWRAMEDGSSTQGTDGWTQQHFGPNGSQLYESSGALKRSLAGRRDFDINMDGMAHYGMLPDLMQDMRNSGVQPQDMTGLYRSAEDYIRVWERCEARRLP